MAVELQIPGAKLNDWIAQCMADSKSGIFKADDYEPVEINVKRWVRNKVGYGIVRGAGGQYFIKFKNDAEMVAFKLTWL